MILLPWSAGIVYLPAKDGKQNPNWFFFSTKNKKRTLLFRLLLEVVEDNEEDAEAEEFLFLLWRTKTISTLRLK